MICKECKCENKEDAKFCANCGKDLVKVKEKTKKPVSEEKTINKQNDIIDLLKDKLIELKDNLIKPLDSMKNKSVDDIKSVAISGGIISLVMMLVHLITSMINACHVMKFDWIKGTTYTWTAEGLKNLNYFDLTIKSLVIYALVMMVIAFVFYIGSLIIKKTIKYQRILSMVFVAMIPIVLGGMILAPIFSLIYNHLGVIIYVISFIYAVIIFGTLLNEELKLEGSIKLYYNTICYSVLVLTAYFILINKVSSLFSGLGI